MNTNLLDEAKSVLTPDFLGTLTGQLGADTSAIELALHGALPTMLGGLLRRASEPGGPSSVMDLTAQVTTPDRTAGEVIEPAHGILDRIASVAAGDPDRLTHVLNMGSDAVLSLFGGKAGAVVDVLARYSGLVPTTASSVLSVAATVMLGVLGRKMATDTDGPLGMVSLLNSQRTRVEQAMPAELGSLLASIPGLELPAIRRAGAETVGSAVATPASPMAGPAPVVARPSDVSRTDPGRA